MTQRYIKSVSSPLPTSSLSQRQDDESHWCVWSDAHVAVCYIVIVVNLFACGVHIVISLKSFPKSISVNIAWGTHIYTVCTLIFAGCIFRGFCLLVIFAF